VTAFKNLGLGQGQCRQKADDILPGRQQHQSFLFSRADDVSRAAGVRMCTSLCTLSPYTKLLGLEWLSWR
jgi:hypothetical protein